MTRRWLRRGIEHLPRGRSLPEDVWRTRHRTLTYLLQAHVPGILVFGWVMGEDATHVAVEAAVVGAFALAAGVFRSRAFKSGTTALGLVLCSAVLVHLSGGMIEMHFHFFVMVCLLSLYQDWLPFLLAIGFVVAHHTVIGEVAPSEVYNHPAAVANPMRWAIIHGFFVLAASAASVVAWRFNEEQALKDSLTGLPSRRLFHDRVAHALARAERDGTSVAVFFVDLDGFKEVNDNFGHNAGDQLLVSVAERIRAAIRPADTAARMGGDEFAVLVEAIGDPSQVALVSDRLVDALAVPLGLRGHDVAVGASVGAALNEPGITVDELLRRADGAMYSAKASGGQRHALHQPPLLLRAASHLPDTKKETG